MQNPPLGTKKLAFPAFKREMPSSKYTQTERGDCSNLNADGTPFYTTQNEERSALGPPRVTRTKKLTNLTAMLSFQMRTSQTCPQKH